MRAAAHRVPFHAELGYQRQIAFYEESPRVKSPVAVLHLRWAGHFLSYKRFLRWLARFDCECERISLVTTFYPCRRGWPNTRCCIRPKRARRTGFGRSAPSIRTAAHIARPRQITGASTNLQRYKLLSLTALRSQICESMSRASSGITPSARKRHSAMSNRRASATMPMRRMRRPPPAKRLWYHWLSALLGCKRNHSQAISTIMALTRRLPALLMP